MGIACAFCMLSHGAWHGHCEAISQISRRGEFVRIAAEVHSREMSGDSGDVGRLWRCRETLEMSGAVLLSLLLITKYCQASHKIVVLPVIVLGEIGSAAKGSDSGTRRSGCSFSATLRGMGGWAGLGRACSRLLRLLCRSSSGSGSGCSGSGCSET
jgi:hypothetical protein